MSNVIRMTDWLEAKGYYGQIGQYLYAKEAKLAKQAETKSWSISDDEYRRKLAESFREDQKRRNEQAKPR